MRSPLGNPPGPIGWPLLGVIPEFRSDPAEFLLHAAREYGEIVYFRLGLQKIFFLNRPDLIGEILFSSRGNFETGIAHPGPLAAQTHGCRVMSLAARNAIFCVEQGEGHWKDGESLPILAEMRRLTLRIMGLTLFSRDVEDGAADLAGATAALLKARDTLLLPFRDLIHMLPVRGAESARLHLNAIILEAIRQRRAAAIQEDDLLSTLLLASQDDREISDEMIALILAGHETVACLLAWTWSLLAQHPDVDARLRSEWSEALGGRPPDSGDLPRLAYTAQVIAEVLRLHPPEWALGRRAISQFRLYNHILPPRAVCLMSPYVMHRNARFWPRPEQFDPERFAAANRASRPRFAYFPFGEQSPACIGEPFAKNQAALLLACIGQRWRFRQDSRVKEEWDRRTGFASPYHMKMTIERVLG